MRKCNISLAVIVLLLAQSSFAYYIIVNPQRAIVEPNAGMTFEAQAFNNSGQPVVVENYTWRVVPEELGEISENGFFQAGEEIGRGEILATAVIGGNRYTGTAYVTVGAPPESDIEIVIRPERAVVPLRGMQLFVALAVGPDGITVPVRSVRWRVEPETLGSINQFGLFKAGPESGSGQVTAIVEIDNQLYRGDAEVVVGAEANSSIAGNVTGEGVDPITGAVVSATRIGYPSFYKRIATDESGNYLLDELIEGKYVLRVEARGYLTEYYDGVYNMREATPVELAPETDLTGYDFELDKGASITGTVKSDGSDELLADVHVQVLGRYSRLSSYETKTDENGVYLIEGLTAGSYVVMAAKSGYTSEYWNDVQRLWEATPIDLDIDSHEENIDFSLAMVSALKGTITEELSGSPLVEATVQVQMLRGERGRPSVYSHRTRTDENGEYSIPLEPGTYAIQAMADGFASEWYENRSEFSEADPVEIPEGEHVIIDMALAAMGQVAGRVTDALTSEPIANAQISAFAEQRYHRRHYVTYSDPDGNYRFGALPAGDYIVLAKADLYLSEYWQEAGSLDEAILVTVTDGTEQPAIDFTLAKGGVLRGTATESETDTPLMGAIVNVTNEDGHVRRQVRTDANGEYEVSGLPIGTYIACAVKRGYDKQWYLNKDSGEEATPIEVTEFSEIADIDFVLHKHAEMGGGGIAGTVFDFDSELPIEGAVVSVMPLQFARPKQEVTDAEGRYEISGLKPGLYLVICRAEGYIGEFYDDAQVWFRAEAVEVLEDQVVPDIDFGLTLQTLGAYLISGTVTDATGAPLEGVLVCAEEDSAVVAASISETDGRYDLRGVPAGIYKLSASVTSFQDGYYSGDSGQEVIVGGGSNFADADIILSVASTGLTEESALPTVFTLKQNYPNPFNPTTEIRFDLPAQAEIKLNIYNVLGRNVRTLYSGLQHAGSHHVTWDGNDNNGVKLSSGIYLYRLDAVIDGKKFTQTKRMLMLK